MAWIAIVPSAREARALGPTGLGTRQPQIDVRPVARSHEHAEVPQRSARPAAVIVTAAGGMFVCVEVPQRPWQGPAKHFVSWPVTTRLARGAASLVPDPAWRASAESRSSVGRAGCRGRAYRSASIHQSQPSTHEAARPSTSTLTLVRTSPGRRDSSVSVLPVAGCTAPDSPPLSAPSGQLYKKGAHLASRKCWSLTRRACQA
jgi:hypothetical protein